MRTATYDEISSIQPDELLSTGEAAKLLNASRQHVVDLCERGELPYATIGTHRRIRRGDLDLLQSRTNRLTSDQRRSLWLAYALTGVIVRNPSFAIRRAKANLKNIRQTSRGQAKRWLDEWEKLLDGPIDNLLQALVSRSPKSRELRQNSPLSGLLSEQERQTVLKAWRQAETKP